MSDNRCAHVALVRVTHLPFGAAPQWECAYCAGRFSIEEVGQQEMDDVAKLKSNE